MRALITWMHDVWCAVTHLCRVRSPDVPTADWLERQESASHDRIRRLRNNPVEAVLLERGDRDD